MLGTSVLSPTLGSAILSLLAVATTALAFVALRAGYKLKA
jgi:hypothetical protein